MKAFEQYCFGGTVVAKLHLNTRWRVPVFLVVYLPLLLFNSIFGPAQKFFCQRVQLAWGFPPRSEWTYGEVFHPAVVPQPLSIICSVYFCLTRQVCIDTSCISLVLTYSNNSKLLICISNV